MKIAYLLTTFPKLSETFLQREIRVLSTFTHDLQLHSLWKGSTSWENHTVHRFRTTTLIRLIPELTRWCIRKPDALCHAAQTLLQSSPANLKNVWETLLGLGYGIVQAHYFERDPPDLLHAAWATMPATASWLIHQLTGIPFSMGAHAYDIYEAGGDGLLMDKVKCAALVHTSTHSAQRYLRQRCATPDHIVLIYRGLNELPQWDPKPVDASEPLHLLSIGRLVEKKGWLEQLTILAALKSAGISFQARIIGQGPMLHAMQCKRQALNLESEVEFAGQIEFSAMEAHYRWADAFLFTGKIAPNGDRDGLPNVIPEAMAYGVPVLTTEVAGTTEAIQHGITGWVLPLNHPRAWVDTLHKLPQEPTTAVRQHARAWVEQYFVAAKNTKTLYEHMHHTHSTAMLARSLG